jgi:hypothetical protein
MFYFYKISNDVEDLLEDDDIEIGSYDVDDFYEF